MDVDGFTRDVLSPLNSWMKTDHSNECVLMVLKRIVVEKPELCDSLRRVIERVEREIAMEGKIVLVPLAIEDKEERFEPEDGVDYPLYDPDAGVSIDPGDPGYEELKRRIRR